MNPHNLYYPQQHLDYQLTMNEHQFHDSGIVDEGLSDETGSVEDDSYPQESHSDANNTPKKPSQSYLEIIAEAILKTPNRMMQLYEIYSYFQRKYRYFAEDVNKSWKNSVRHNLSLNDCFVKAGRGTNGKGHFWRIHEMAEREFEQGRFRRRRYRQQMRELQQPSYETASSYPPSSYYMCSPPPSYHTIYPHPSDSSTPNFCLSSPTSYTFYDPYSTPYYPQQHHPMTMSYTNPKDSVPFDV